MSRIIFRIHFGSSCCFGERTAFPQGRRFLYLSLCVHLPAIAADRALALQTLTGSPSVVHATQEEARADIARILGDAYIVRVKRSAEQLQDCWATLTYSAVEYAVRKFASAIERINGVPNQLGFRCCGELRRLLSSKFSYALTQ